MKRLHAPRLLVVALLLVAVLAPGLARAQSGDTPYYVYDGERVPLQLVPDRLAVQVTGLGVGTGIASVLAATGIEVARSRQLGVDGWRMLDLSVPGAKTSLEAARRVPGSLAAVQNVPGVDFVSPVFRGMHGGWVVITPRVLVRLHQPARGNFAFPPPLSLLTQDFGGMAGAYEFESDAGNGLAVLEVANRLAEDPRVAWAEPDMMFTGHHVSQIDPQPAHPGSAPALFPNDPLFPDVWGVHNTGQFGGVPGMDMDGPEAWDITKGDAGVKVLIIDTGVQLDHPDLNVAGGADFTGDATFGNPGNACDNHGTAVAGCVSAVINNGVGTVGIASDSPILAARIGVANQPCDGSFITAASWTVHALAWGFVRGAKVSNNSNGYGFMSSAIDDAYASTRTGGMLHFSSAGNGGQQPIGYPASLPTILAIAALAPNGQLATFSNFGPGIPVCAPGVSVMTTDRTGVAGWIAGDYVFAGGTSFSSPYVAGVAALIYSMNPSRSASEVESILFNGARDLGVPGFDGVFGYGFVNAFNVVTLAQGTADVGDPDVPTKPLMHIAPNPSVGATTLSLGLRGAGAVRLIVFDASGRLVRVVADGMFETGNHSFTWDGRDATGAAVRPGVYFARLETLFGLQTRRFVRLD